MAGSHKRETNARFVPRAVVVAAPVAVLATTSAVTLGVANSPVEKPAKVLLAEAPKHDLAGLITPRTARVSRSAVRDVKAEVKQQQSMVQGRIEAQNRSRALEAERTATAKAIKNADTKLWAKTALNVWNDSADSARQIGTVEDGTKVTATGRKADGRVEIVLNGQSRWVNADYVTDEKPLDTSGTGGECTNGTTIASWVSPKLQQIHQAVCARFPQIQVYGTRTGSGDHGTGRAVDIMLSGELGWQVAEYLKANWQAFGISYLIYEQKIWSVERSGEGWRGMSNRGSITANHFDHVHVSVY